MYIALKLLIMDNNWFANWFDSEYYHQLYKHRNDEEAQTFINNLIKYLQPKPLSKVLDLACGKGRHSIMLHQHKLDVTGMDLSKNSIEFAQQFATETLQFSVHDMRAVSNINYYDFVFNFFTSFGYFATIHDDILAAKAMIAACKSKGIICIDFINSKLGIQQLSKNISTEKTEGDVQFIINKKIENKKFIKTIDVNDGNKPTQHFIEIVQALELQDFINIFENNGTKILHTFGNYLLEPFDEKSSSRLIMLFQKD